MFRSIPRLAAVLLLCSGCGSGATTELSGEVTMNGVAVKKGNVRLEPEGGLGTPEGAEIVDGRYTVKKLKPGKYRLHVEGEPEGTPGMSQADVMKLSEKEIRARSTNPVPTDAEGNDISIEAKGGNQTQDVKLTSKTK